MARSPILGERRDRVVDATAMDLHAVGVNAEHGVAGGVHPPSHQIEVFGSVDDHRRDRTLGQRCDGFDQPAREDEGTHQWSDTACASMAAINES